MLVLHVSPHPDDESLACPATLLGLRDHGARVANLAVSLGRPEESAVRGAELRNAIGQANFDLFEFSEPVDISSTNPQLAGLESQLGDDLAELFLRLEPDLVISPDPSEPHPGHALVGRATAQALHAYSAARWWSWGLWGELPEPNLLSVFEASQLLRAERMLACHASQLQRNDYVSLLWGRAQVAAVRGPELTFGFGAPGLPRGCLAELLCERLPQHDFSLGRPRRLDLSDPLGSAA